MNNLGQYDIWHDRAVFHFLTEAQDRARYIELLDQTVVKNGYWIIGTFAIGGPSRCSDLEVCPYDATSISQQAGSHFQLMEWSDYHHHTPQGGVQKFFFAILKKIR